MIRGLLVLLLFLLLGEGASALLPLPVPGSVLGMVLLALALQRRLVPLEMVKPTADTLVRNMAFFFVPAGVGLLVQGEILRREWLPIVIASVVSALAVLVVVGRLAQRMEKR